MKIRTTMITMTAVSWLVVALAPAATIEQTSSDQLNLTGRTVLAAVNFYDPDRIANGQRTVDNPIQGVTFDNFRVNVDDDGWPWTLQNGGTLATVIAQNAGREYGSDPTALAFLGPDAAEAEKLANAGAYFQDSVGATLTFAFGPSYADAEVEVQMLGGGLWARTDRTGSLVFSVDGVELGLLEDRGTPDLLTFLATTDGSGGLLIDIENGLSDLNTTEPPGTERRFAMLTGAIVTIPEPGTIALLGLAGLAMFIRRRFVK